MQYFKEEITKSLYLKILFFLDIEFVPFQYKNIGHKNTDTQSERIKDGAVCCLYLTMRTRRESDRTDAPY